MKTLMLVSMFFGIRADNFMLGLAILFSFLTIDCFIAAVTTEKPKKSHVYAKWFMMCASTVAWLIFYKIISNQ